MYMKATSLLTVTLIVGVILLVTGMGIETAFAQANLHTPGQSGRNPGQTLGALPPGQAFFQG